MLYTLFILFSGVYLGQEYEVIPSMRILTNNMLIYLNTLKEQPQEQVIQQNYLGSFFKYFF